MKLSNQDREESMACLDAARVKQLVSEILERFWLPMYSAQEVGAEVRRYSFHAQLIINACAGSGSVCDIGGGWGALSAVCSKIGLKAFLVDDFADSGFFSADDPRHAMSSEYGFTSIAHDVIGVPFPFEKESLDVVSTFDSMEHWHRSPKKLFEQIVHALRPGGTFVIGVPNCVNLRKRLTIPFGYGKWSSMNDWYEAEVFRGHVREPDVDDLRYIAHDLGLVDIRILGRNWAGLANRSSWIRAGTFVLDPVLRLRSSVCSDIYLIGRKASKG